MPEPDVVPFARYPKLRFVHRGSTWSVEHPDWPMRLSARDIYYGTGRLLATLSLDRTDVGKPIRILTSSVDLLTARHRTTFATEAAKRHQRSVDGSRNEDPEIVISLTTLTDAMLERLLEAHFEIERIDLLDVEPPADRSPHYVVWPIVPHSRPGLLIAPSGSGKSTLAAGIAIGVVTGVDIVPGITAREHGPVMYIGQEEDATQMRSRVDMLMRGHQIEFTRGFYYMKLKGGSLVDSAELIAEHCADVKAKLVIIDSAQATWGESDSGVREWASRWFGAVEILGVPALIIDHPSLAGMKQKPGAELMAAGTSVKRDRSGHVWTVRSIEVPVRDGQPYKYHVTLTDAKRNYVGRQPNIDYESMVNGYEWSKFIEAGEFDAQAVVDASRNFSSMASIMREPDELHEEGWTIKELAERLQQKDDRRIRAEAELGQWRPAPWSSEEEVTIVKVEGSGTSPNNPGRYLLEKRHVAVQMSMAPGDEGDVH